MSEHGIQRQLQGFTCVEITDGRLVMTPRLSALSLQNIATPELPSNADATEWYLECKVENFLSRALPI